MTAGVVGAGSWGRRRSSEGNLDDRQRRGHDHPYTFTGWLAGGGIRPGLTYRASDDLAMIVAEDPVHMHDLHATALQLLGIGHPRLTYRFQGRDFRLTDVHGEVVEAVLA
jgi:hypothetical protein